MKSTDHPLNSKSNLEKQQIMKPVQYTCLHLMIIGIILALIIPNLAQAKQPKSDPWFQQFWAVAQSVKNKRARQALKKVLTQPEKYRFQVLITEYQKTESGKELLIPHRFRVDHEYFYPASAIKTYASIAALRHYTLLRQDRPWLTTNDPMSRSKRTCQKKDPSNTLSTLASLEHEIKKTQLVSSNKAFNTVFNVTGFRQLHEYIQPDFPSVRVFHRLSSRESHQESLQTPALHICNWTKTGPNHKQVYLRNKSLSKSGLGDLISATPVHKYTGFEDNQASLKVGRKYKHMKSKKLIDQPMDFTYKNRSSFYDFQRLNMGMYILNQSTPFGPAIKLLSVASQSAHSSPTSQAEHLTPPSDSKALIRKIWLNELRHAMVIYPRHSENPKYPKKSLSETRFKPLIRGVRWASKKLKNDDNIYYLNKAGKALGFHMDNAFIAYGHKAGIIKSSGFPEKSPKRGLFVTVGLYVNEDQVLNDDRYEYSKISVPVLNAIGYAIGRYLINDWPK